jgi:hypothetical protein
MRALTAFGALGVFCLDFSLGVLLAGLLFNRVVRKVHAAYRADVERLSAFVQTDSLRLTKNVSEIQKVLASGDVQKITELQNAMASGDEAAVARALRSRGAAG